MIVQLTRVGTLRDDAAIAEAREAFRQHHCVKLPRFIEPALLARVHAELGRGEFRAHTHGDIASELKLQPGVCTGLLHFILNDPALYGMIEALTGCAPIHSFIGRVYRREPNGGHFDSWHGDLVDGREVGLSLNLSDAPDEGGVFQIRDETMRETGSIANTGDGDAILFRLAPNLMHHVTEVRGAVAKTAYAGWFRSVP